MQLRKPAVRRAFRLLDFRMLEHGPRNMQMRHGPMAEQTIETLSEKLDRLIAAVSRLAPAAVRGRPILPRPTASSGPPILAFWSRCTASTASISA